MVVNRYERTEPILGPGHHLDLLRSTTTGPATGRATGPAASTAGAARTSPRLRTNPTKQKIPPGSKVYVAPMDGFETYLKDVMIKKKVPVVLVEQRDQASYEITGVAESKKAGGEDNYHGKLALNRRCQYKIANLKTGELVYAYSVHKQSSAHGKQSTAESCAKHVKDEAVAPK